MFYILFFLQYFFLSILLHNKICLQQASGSFPGKEEMEKSFQKMEKDLKETAQQRDKALQQLNRLKQHLLQKV